MSQIPDPNIVPPAGDVPPAGGVAPTPATTPPLAYATPTPPGPYTGPAPTSDEKSMAMLCYILAIFGLLGWVGPLIIWQTKKDTSPFVNDQAKEVLNWELTIIPVYLLFMFTFCIPFLNILGLLCFMGVGVTNLIFCILGAVKANQGIAYRLPFSIKYIK
jgi:hypothetical protein